MVAPVRTTLRWTAPTATKATAPMSVGCASVTLGNWVHAVSVQRRNTAPRTTTAAAPNLRMTSAMGGATVFVDSAHVTVLTLGKCGGNTVSVMTSTACDSKESCAQVSECMFGSVGNHF